DSLDDLRERDALTHCGRKVVVDRTVLRGAATHRVGQGPEHLAQHLAVPTGDPEAAVGHALVVDGHLEGGLAGRLGLLNLELPAGSDGSRPRTTPPRWRRRPRGTSRSPRRDPAVAAPSRRTWPSLAPATTTSAAPRRASSRAAAGWPARRAGCSRGRRTPR